MELGATKWLVGSGKCFKKMYLATLSLSCCMPGLHCTMLDFVVAHGLSSCGVWASSSMAVGSYFPDQGLNQRLLHCKVNS